MKLDLTHLPDDVDLLHQLIADLSNEVITLTDENTSLKAQLALLKKQRYGSPSEKLDTAIADLEARIEESEMNELSSVPSEPEEDRVDNGTTDTVKATPKRNPLPEHLVRDEVVLSPEPNCSSCGGDAFRKIEDDVTEMLDYQPPSFRVLRTVRPRCACTACDNVIQAELPSFPISKGKATAGLLAHLLVQKYANHLPLYRQSEIYAREGIELSRSTMAGWVGQCARLLQPLVDVLRQDVFASDHLHGDDTTVRVLSPQIGKTKTGRMWVYVRDGRASGSDYPPAVCYYYSPDRKGIRPEGHLSDFKGVLHADAYAGYNGVYHTEDNLKGTVTASSCWAHVRRKFYEVTVTTPNAGIAAEAVKQIAALYKIEKEIRGKDPATRLAYRQEHAKEKVVEWFKWLLKCHDQLPKKSQTAKAIQYALKLKTSLSIFLEDGAVEIDNNIAERAMRPIAVGRKNWLFAGSDKGGESAANIFSLIQTAILNGVNPHAYLKKVLENIQEHNSRKLHELLPWNINLHITEKADQ